MLHYSKKSQIGLIEMIMVILVVLVLLSVAIFFYYKLFISKIEATSQELSIQEADILLSSIASMPELQCSFRTTTKPCIDTLKLIVNNQFTQDNMDYYASLFGFKTIKIKQIYPQSTNAECTLTNYNSFSYPQNCNTWIIYNNPKQGDKLSVSTPISLYFPTTKEYKAGKLFVEVYR